MIVPSLINPPSIVDLAPGRSLTRFLADQGFHVFVVDWGTPTAADAALDLAGHVERLLLPLIDAIGEAAPVIGYCLGGTLALAAAVLRPLPAVAVIAAPWRFAGYGETARGDMAALWARAEPSCRSLGLLPTEVLQAAFWRLDPRRTIIKYAAFADLPPDSEAARDFVRLEDWANGGAPLPFAAGKDVFETFLRDDDPGRGRWRIANRAIDVASLTCPAIEFVSASDRIAPAPAAAGLAERRTSDAGHVGMMIGRYARASLWRPLAAWLAALPA